MLAGDFWRTPEGKRIYSELSQTIEQVFADAKKIHFLKYTQLRGLHKMKILIKVKESMSNTWYIMLE